MARRPSKKFSFTLTPSTKLKIHTAIQWSLAASTLRSYQSAVRHYLVFCQREGIPPKLRTPAPEQLLCAFAAAGLDRLW